MFGKVTFLEIGTGDAAETRNFFGQMFGWRFHPMGDGAEGWFETPAIRVGLHGNDPEPSIAVYFEVDDIAAAAARVRLLGGTAEGKIADEPDFGRFVSCRDPRGIRFGLHERSKA